MRKGGLLLLAALGAWSGETSRLKTPLFYGGAVFKGFHEKGGSAGRVFLIRETSQDKPQSFTANNPVRAGSGREAGVRNQSRFFNALLETRG